MIHSEEIKALAEGIADRDTEIERLKGLCGRAADALENWHTGQQLEPPHEVKLIAELREAAK